MDAYLALISQKCLTRLVSHVHQPPPCKPSEPHNISGLSRLVSHLVSSHPLSANVLILFGFSAASRLVSHDVWHAMHVDSLDLQHAISSFPRSDRENTQGSLLSNWFGLLVCVSSGNSLCRSSFAAGQVADLLDRSIRRIYSSAVAVFSGFASIGLR